MSAKIVPQNVVSGKAPLTHGVFRFDPQIVDEPIPMCDDQHIAYPFVEKMLASERADYLLDYGHDVVARLQPRYTHIATALAAQLASLEAHLHAAQMRRDYTMLPLVVAQIDDALVPGELLLREVAA
ncbi:MAG: hypothetical protein H0X24_16620 [Ktedonobacterales bacterium]|nr:hypothetical protein [Ktedonobacterales bacterium]